MVNRIPLVLDVEDGNKIKELPAGDNLNLSENNIVNVQDINALGTINAAIITVNGERLVAQNFLDLTDGPNTYVGSEDYFVKVNETGTGLEFRPIQDIGNLVIDTITISERLEPTADNLIEVGTEANKIAEVWAYGLRGSLVGYDGTLVFDAATNKISYAALQGAPQFLSEFQNDVGYLRTVDLDATWQALFEGGRAIGGDLVGSVFSNDSVLMVDALESKIRGDIEFNPGTGFIQGEQIAILADTTVDIGEARLVANITPVNAEGGSIGTEQLPFGNAHLVEANIRNINSQQLDLNDNLGIGSLYGTTDLLLDAGNRVKIGKGVPFKIGMFDVELDYVAGQPGDIIYNSQTNKFQLYQDTEGTIDWVSLHEGTFKGDIYGSFYADDGLTQVIRGSDGYITNPTITGNATFLSNVQVDGNLTILGTTTTVDTENTVISDNVIVLNQGEIGAGVTLGSSGIEIERGSESNVRFIYREADDLWTTEGVPLNVENITGSTGLSIVTKGDVDGELITIAPGGIGTFVNITADFIRLQGSIEENILATAGVTGDLTGSVFSDDSGVIVDAVNNTLNANNLNVDTITSNSTLGITAGAAIVARATDMNIGTTAGPLYLSSNGSAVTLSGNNGFGSIVYDDNTGNINLGTTGTVTIQGAATSPVNIGTGTSGTVTLGNGSNTVDIASGSTLDLNGVTVTDAAFNLTGNIDNTTLNIGTTTATAINIGRTGSTTTIDGIIQFTDALIANNLTADDSIIIQTEGNTANEAITIFPKGSDTRINLRADGVNFIGPVVSNIDAVGGVTGDVIGSVFSQDSVLLVDALDGILRGNIDNGAAGTIDTGTLTVGTEIKATRLTNLTPGITDIDVSAAGTVEIEAGTNAGAGTSNITIDKLGVSYITMTTEPINPASSDALISINTTAAAGDVQIGSAASSRNQVVTIYNADINGSLFGTVNGTVNGSLIGSVFAEDSSTMVDATNYAMFSDTLSLTPLSVEPDNIVDGMMVISDGTGWDPLSTSVQTLMVYLGGSWRQIASSV